MDLRNVFIDSSYQVRSGMKFLSYSVLLGGLWVATNVVMELVVWFFPIVLKVPQGDYRFLIPNSIVLFIPSAATLLIMARALDRTSLGALGVALHDNWVRDFIVGVTVSAAMLGFVFIGSLVLGGAHIDWSASVSAIPALFFTLAALAVSAFAEELVFRGYPLQILMKGLGPWWSTILISSLFGLVHAVNRGATLLSILGTIIAGFVLALAYLKTRSIWFPYGIHLGWNVGLSMVLGYPMSGIQTASIAVTHVSGSRILFGGEYGPEAGIWGFVVFAAAGVVLRRMRGVKVSPQVRAALAAHADKLYVET